MPVEKSLENTHFSHIPTLKTKRKEYANVKINTDPWFPQCSTCKEREQREFAFGTGTVDINEYAKAINYINSIHALINECLSKQNSCSSQPKQNFSMPDIPNFLSVLSCLNFNSSSSTPSSANFQMVSRSTSTSSLSNSCTVLSKQIEKDSHGIHTSRRNEDCRKLNLQQTCAHEEDPNNKHGQNITHEETQRRNCKTANVASHPLPNQILSPHRHNSGHDLNQHGNRTSNNHKITINSTQKKITGNESEFMQKVEKNKACLQQHLTRKSRNKSRSPIYYPLTETDRSKMSDTLAINDSKAKEYESILSEADIDRYAIELLVGKLDVQLDENSTPEKTYTIPASQPLAKMSTEKCRPSKTRIYQMPSSEPVKRRILEKLKEVTPSLNESKPTLISITQNCRSHLHLNSITSKIPVVQQNSDTSSNDTPTVMGSKNNLPINNLDCGLTEKNVHPDTKIISSPSNNYIHAKTSKTNIPQADPQCHKITSDKKGFVEKMYKVQQKDDDDFVCARKSVKGRVCKQPSESIAFQNQQIRFPVIPASPDNLIYADASDQRKYKTPQPYVFQIITKKSSRKLNVCSKKDSRHNLIQRPHKSSCSSFESTSSNREGSEKRQQFSRSDCSNDEEIINIRNYASQHKQINTSDTNSNCSRTTTSSDIKSDHKSVI